MITYKNNIFHIQGDGFSSLMRINKYGQLELLHQLYFPLLLFHSCPTSPLGKNTFSVLHVSWKKSGKKTSC